MGDDQSIKDSMRHQLEQKERELGLLREMDRIRDTAADPSAMLTGIAGMLCQFLGAQLAVLCLTDRESGELELKAMNDQHALFAAIGTEPIKTIAGLALKAGRIIAADDIGTGTGLPEGVAVAATAISLNDRTLGAIVIARDDRPFNGDEIRLFEAAEDQIDSAVIQGYAHYDLEQRNRELEVVYAVDRIRDRNLPFDDMLGQVLKEMQTAVPSEAGFIMLFDNTGTRLELRSSTHGDMFAVPALAGTVETIAHQALKERHLIVRNEPQADIRSIVCIPLILDKELIGVLGMVNRFRSGGFGVDDRRLLTAIGSQMDTAIFESLEKRRLKEVLGRAVDPRVMQRILSRRDVSFLKGEKTVVSVLYADIRGSTSLAERSAPEPLVEFINDYLGAMTGVILSHEGTLDKFVGDEVMALFGAPFPQADHALRAVHVGLEMQTAHAAVMARAAARGIEAAPIGIGIATGELIAGEMGCALRTDYTVIGRAANLGARICSAAAAGQVLVCGTTYDLIREQVSAVPVKGLSLKGIGADMTVYHVTGSAEL